MVPKGGLCVYACCGALRNALLETSDVDRVFLDQLPERAAVFLRDLRGLSDVAFTDREHALNVIPFETSDLLGLRFLKRFSSFIEVSAREEQILNLDPIAFT
jgi:hypothetical protein